jgi:hypothetical protein
MSLQGNSDFLPDAAIPYAGGDEAPLGWFVEISPYINNKNTNWDNFTSNAMCSQNTVVASRSASLTGKITRRFESR